jgi:dienelactone hydrolase
MRLIAGALACGLVLAAAPPFELPAPSGPHAVGTTSWTLTDPARAEAYVPGERRRVKVVAWYPVSAASSAGRPAARGVRAPYLREGVDEARVFASLIRAQPGSYDAIADVETHAVIEAPPLPGGRLPAILFAAGYGGVASAHAALVEDLASHGYVVLAIAHPYETTFVSFADGRSASMLDDAGAPRAPYREVIGEWGKEDETMAAVTRAGNVDEQRRLLRDFLATIPKTTAALQRWVDDTKLVLDRLPTLSAASPAGRLAARIDAGAMGAAGHSMGGVAAADFCAVDRRCRAALNLDGSPQYGAMIDRTMPGAMLMVYSARPGRAGANDAIYRGAAARYYRVDVAGTKHLDFSDLNFWGGRLREVPALGDIDPARASTVVRTIVREYFDQELRGRRSPLLAGAATLPEARVVR